MAPRRVRSDLTLPTRRGLMVGAAAALIAPIAARAAPDGGWTPFDDSGGLIRLEGAVNGHPVNVTLDSGAGRVIIDRAFAEKIGLEVRDRTNVLHGLSQSRPGGYSSSVVIALGNDELHLPEAVLADLSALKDSGYDSPVLLGRDIFERFCVDLDMVGKRIAFRRRGPFESSAFRRTALRGRKDTQQIPLIIEGRRRASAVLDLGLASPLAMARAFAKSAGLLDGRPASAWLGTGIEGVNTFDVATATQVELAGMSFRDVPFDAYPVWNRAASAPVSVGYPLLRRFGRLIIDYGSGSLFSAMQPPPPEPFRKNRIGLAVTPLESGGYRIDFVAPGSPAARGLWEKGDLVAAINGDARMTAQARSALAATSRIVYTMADGSVRELKPAEYY